MITYKKDNSALINAIIKDFPELSSKYDFIFNMKTMDNNSLFSLTKIDLNGLSFEDIIELVDGIRKTGSRLNIPEKIFYTEESGVTVVLFSDGTKVKVVAENDKNKNVHNGILIAMAKKYFPNITIKDLYTNKTSEDKFAEATIKHLVLGFLIGAGVFKNEKEFSKWLVKLLAEKVYLTISKNKTSK